MEIKAIRKLTRPDYGHVMEASSAVAADSAAAELETVQEWPLLLISAKNNFKNYHIRRILVNFINFLEIYSRP